MWPRGGVGFERERELGAALVIGGVQGVTPGPGTVREFLLEPSHTQEMVARYVFLRWVLALLPIAECREGI